MKLSYVGGCASFPVQITFSNWPQTIGCRSKTIQWSRCVPAFAVPWEFLKWLKGERKSGSFDVVIFCPWSEVVQVVTGTKNATTSCVANSRRPSRAHVAALSAHKAIYKSNLIPIYLKCFLYIHVCFILTGLEVWHDERDGNFSKLMEIMSC